MVLAGVLTTMTAAGLVLVAVAVPTSRLLIYLTPLVDGLLVLLGTLLILGRNPFDRLPTVRVPVLANPFGQAYVYGVLLGPLAFPCAGPFLVSLLAISVGLADAAGRLTTFLVFGLGFGLPLVLLSLLAAARGQRLVHWLVAHHRRIEIGSGVLLIGAAVFDVVDKWDSIRLALGF
jgi:cytochrome c-type biogenesis protein